MRYLLVIRRPSKSAVFAMLMAASVVLLMLPRDPMAPLKRIAQAITAPPQLAAHRAANDAGDAVRKLTRQPVAGAKHAALLEQRDTLQNENIALKHRLTELQSTVAELSALRRQGLASKGVLVPARIVALDAAPGRESLLITKGSRNDIEQGDWVVSGLEIDAGTEDGIDDACAVLARQSLIGWIEQAGPMTSRVALLTDPHTDTPLPVHLAEGSGDHRFLKAGKEIQTFALYGAGAGRMVIRDITKEFISTKQIRLGDLVTTTGKDPRLPMMIVIGRIDSLQLNQSKPVYYDAVVRPIFDARSLERVIVANLTPR